MYPQVLLQNRKPDRIATLEEYRQSGGYRALADVLTDYSCRDVRQAIMDAAQHRGEEALSGDDFSRALTQYTLAVEMGAGDGGGRVQRGRERQAAGAG